jgi:hypothetical protein
MARAVLRTDRDRPDRRLQRLVGQSLFTAIFTLEVLLEELEPMLYCCTFHGVSFNEGGQCHVSLLIVASKTDPYHILWR